MIAIAKTCLSCYKTIQGRADKKFCNDHCRNAHHNLLNGGDNNYVRNINHLLRRNRRILEGFMPGNKVRVYTRLQGLQNKGFIVDYCTHTLINRKGDVYRFCYEYGWHARDGGEIAIVKKNHAK